jgi:hypothetical protein
MYIKILFCIFIINVWRKRVRHRKQEVHEVLLHVHMSMSDQHGVGHGEHLVEGRKVLLTTDMVTRPRRHRHQNEHAGAGMALNIYTHMSGEIAMCGMKKVLSDPVKRDVGNAI